MKLFVVGVALATLVASPAFAQSRVAPGGARFQSPYSAYGAVTPFGSPSLDLNIKDHVSAARAAAIVMGDRELKGTRGLNRVVALL